MLRFQASLFGVVRSLLLSCRESKFGKRCSEERVCAGWRPGHSAVSPGTHCVTLDQAIPSLASVSSSVDEGEVELVRSFFMVRFHPCFFLHLALT